MSSQSVIRVSRGRKRAKGVVLGGFWFLWGNFLVVRIALCVGIQAFVGFDVLFYCFCRIRLKE